MPKVGGTVGKYFHESVPLAVALDFQRLEDGFARFADMGNVGDRNALDMNRRLELVDQFAHVERIAGLAGIATVRAG